VPQLQHQSGEEEEQREGLGKERGENDEPVAVAGNCWIDPNGRPTARDSVSGGPLDPAP
jgi:hypothetical protein